jgi:hypothetical protein
VEDVPPDGGSLFEIHGCGRQLRTAELGGSEAGRRRKNSPSRTRDCALPSCAVDETMVFGRDESPRARQRVAPLDGVLTDSSYGSLGRRSGCSLGRDRGARAFWQRRRPLRRSLWNGDGRLAGPQGLVGGNVGVWRPGAPQLYDSWTDPDFLDITSTLECHGFVPWTSADGGYGMEQEAKKKRGREPLVSRWSSREGAGVRQGPFDCSESKNTKMIWRVSARTREPARPQKVPLRRSFCPRCVPARAQGLQRLPRQ